MYRILLLIIISINSILAQNNWQTEFEKSNFLSTSNYQNSIKYFQQIADYSEFAELKTIGISPQGRELKCLIVSKNKIFNPVDTQRNNDAIILINNGIHSGEIEGKDASMLMLREMLITGDSKSLLDNVILLVIPVFNLDGHERSSKYGRINQNGPTEMGWRVTAQNLNLNRDFTKADSPEMKAFLKLYSDWLPDIFIDNHTTNGADYQYTITYAISKDLDVPPATRELVKNEIIPSIENSFDNSNYLISPFVGFLNRNYNNGIRDWVPTPRFSNGYGSIQNRIGLLVETHMLKPYKDRVFSTKVLMESVIKYSNQNSLKLKSVSKKADEYIVEHYSQMKKAFPIKISVSKDSVDFNYKGFERKLIDSKIAGGKVVNYTKIKTEKIVPYFNMGEIQDSVLLPYAYIIPQEWSSLIEIIKLHGISVTKILKEEDKSIEQYKFKNVKFSKWPYEGRFIPSFDYDVIEKNVKTKPGDYLIEVNQRTLGLIAHLLEPKANDSFVKWGFMNVIFERKEYFEEYSMEPIAQKMYEESEELRTEFNHRVNSDSTFANNKRARLNFFYKRSPYYDEKHNIYPILRVLN